MSKHEAILQYAKQHPTASTGDIARAVGTTAAYVIAAKSRARRPRFQLSKENADWLTNQSTQLGVSLDDVINGCITDARLDEEEQNQKTGVEKQENSNAIR